MSSTDKTMSRRAFTTLAGLGAAALGSGALFGCSSQGASSSAASAAASSAEESSMEASASAASSSAMAEGASGMVATKVPDPGQIVWTHCAVNCGCCCAWKAHVVDGVITYIETDDTGSPEFGQRQLRACGRGRSARRWLQDPDRLNYPLKRVEGSKRGEGKYEQISWDEAIETIASELKRIRETYGDEAIFSQYASGTSGSIMNSSCVSRLLAMNGGYVGYYGSYSSAQIGQAGTFTYGGGTYGSSFLTLQDNQLVVLFANAVTEGRPGGCGHTYDLGVMREQKNVRIINIDPRLNDTTTGQGGEWIPIRPGTDAALVSALAYELITHDWVDKEFLDKYCIGYDEDTMPEAYKGQNKSYKDYILGTGYDKVEKTPAWASKITGIPEERIVKLAEELHEADPVYIAQGYGLNRRSNGEIAARSIMVLPQLLGQVGKPGTNDGRREGAQSLALASPLGVENPLKTQISCFNWPDAITHGEDMTALNAGVKGTDKLSTSFKFIFNYAGNCFTNQHSDINHIHDILADDSLVEFIVTSEVFMTDSAKYSDIILPDLTSQEQLSIGKNGYADNMIACIYGQPVYDPPFERRGIYEVCCDIAEKLGFGEEYSEGKTREDWYKKAYEAAREKEPDLPTWEEGMKMGCWKKDPAEKIIHKDFVEDPEANPLPTPSGKIEIFSEQLAEIAATWELGEKEYISPIPEYDPAWDGLEDLTEEYPLQICGFQSKAHTHSSYGNNTIIASVTHDACWINPIDAEPRGIKTGDTVRIFNDRGELRIPAVVTPRVMPGVVSSPTGAWHNADMAGDRIDHGGCINTITRYKPTALGKANPQHSIIGQVAKA